MTETYADQRAHDVAWMTAAERDQLTTVDRETWTRTDVIAVLSPDNGDGTATVARMAYSVRPHAGEVFGRIGELMTLVYRDAPQSGAVWAGPCGVNCSEHGAVTCAAYEWPAWKATRDHLAAYHPADSALPAAWGEHGFARPRTCEECGALTDQLVTRQHGAACSLHPANIV